MKCRESPLRVRGAGFPVRLSHRTPLIDKSIDQQHRTFWGAGCPKEGVYRELISSSAAPDATMWSPTRNRVLFYVIIVLLLLEVPLLSWIFSLDHRNTTSKTLTSVMIDLRSQVKFFPRWCQHIKNCRNHWMIFRALKDAYRWIRTFHDKSTNFLMCHSRFLPTIALTGGLSFRKSCQEVYLLYICIPCDKFISSFLKKCSRNKPMTYFSWFLLCGTQILSGLKLLIKIAKRCSHLACNPIKSI